MAVMTQDIVTNTKTVIQGLEALRHENRSIHSGLLSSLEAISRDSSQNDPNVRLIEEKATIVQKTIENIELGLTEAEVMIALAGHLQTVEAEKQKLRTQVKRLCQENAWLRDELANTIQKLQVSEQKVAQLEEEKKHLEFMNSIKKYDVGETSVSYFFHLPTHQTSTFSCEKSSQSDNYLNSQRGLHIVLGSYQRLLSYQIFSS